MDAVRTLLRDWLGREGLGPNEVIIFHRCCDELEAAIKADTSEECRIQAENERLTRVVEQATKYMSIEDDEIVIRQRHGDSVQIIGTLAADPDLCAQLKGADRG